MKNTVILLSIFCSFLLNAQDLNYLERFRLVEKFGNENKINLGNISKEKLRDIMRFAGGVYATETQAEKIQGKIQSLDSYIQGLSPGQKPSIYDLKTNLGISESEAKTLAKLIFEHANDPSPQNFLAAALARKYKIPLGTIGFLEQLIKEASRPSRPTSPTSLSLRRIFKRTANIQRMRLPKASGDYLTNMQASLDYAYTEYEDDTIGTSGELHDWSLSLHGTLFENTDLSFGIVANESEGKGSLANDYRGETIGVDIMLLHKLADNYGLGAFGFYQHSDYETLDTRDYGSGMGMLFSTWHDLGFIELSTVNSVTKTYYEAGNDTLYNLSLNLTRYWTDRFSTTFKAIYTDSLDSDVDGDNSYWSIGGSIGYLITDNLYGTIGYSTDKALKDYESQTWNIGFTWSF